MAVTFRSTIGAACALAALAASGSGAAEPQLLRTTFPLDEPRGYCVDITGFAATLRLDEPLQAHTCKYGEPLEDQLFEPGTGGTIRASRYERCLAAAALDAGAALLARPCDPRARAQQWSIAAGQVASKAKPDLCIAVAAERGTPAGTPRLISPTYRRQDLQLARCAEGPAARTSLRWSPVDERPSAAADVARRGMPADVAAALAAFGHEFDGAIAAKTVEIYAPVRRIYDPSEINVVKDLPYGSHERQQLDVHTGTTRNYASPAPVIVIFHGGGLVAGNRAANANVADYFASLGYVGANAGYRLAPDAQWPEGGRDVAAAVGWLHAHAAEYGGDPERIFVAGISSGALHAATYVFRPELMPADAVRPAGAILVSGPYTFDFENPSRGELAYFGEDRTLWADRVIPGHLTRTEIPVLFTTAEWDNPRYTGPFAKIYAELVLEHGVVARYHQSLGHNHTSQLLSLGTEDTSVSAELIDFIEGMSVR
jgi:acetyl esterase/lipase